MLVHNTIFKYYYKSILFRDKLLKRFPECFLKTKTIFTHIPKAAGISITNAIYGQEVGHVPLKVYKHILGKEFPNYYKFTFVRNPIERFESAYYFLKGGGLNDFDLFYSKKVIGRYSDINDFVMNYLDKKTVFDYIHFFPQNYFLEDDNSELYDFVGKIENLEHDLKRLENIIGMKIIISKKNVTKIKEDIKLSNESLSKLKRIYKKDFEKYGYIQ